MAGGLFISPFRGFPKNLTQNRHLFECFRSFAEFRLPPKSHLPLKVGFVGVHHPFIEAWFKWPWISEHSIGSLELRFSARLPFATACPRIANRQSDQKNQECNEFHNSGSVDLHSWCSSMLVRCANFSRISLAIRSCSGDACNLFTPDTASASSRRACSCSSMVSGCPASKLKIWSHADFIRSIPSGIQVGWPIL